ncbi:hypothetical protein [Nocardia transvalensis]|uniref:hypothetical protein n=1 Tax=Nocardia transvalensis TaxID=37333 RepID=UPI0018956B3C|nr:hypothetical protein [Nocardia transvalensis]MBF6328456.1 hypothetical protein [Nocardia transvalensis]
MTTYLDSRDLPFRLQFPATDSSVVPPPPVPGSHTGIFTVALTHESGAVANRYLLVNFGAVACLTVHDQVTLDDPHQRRITCTASLTQDGDLDIETRSRSAHTS